MPIVTDGLIGYWNSKQGVSGSTWENIAPATTGNYNGAITGAVLQADGMYFDGVDDKVEIPNFDIPKFYTYEIGLRGFNANIGNGFLFGFGSTDRFQHYTSDSTYGLYVTHNNQLYKTGKPATTIKKHIIIQFTYNSDSKQGNVYVDNQLFHSFIGVDMYLTLYTLSIAIHASSTLKYKGHIDFLRAYNYDLSPQQLQQNYAVGTEVGLTETPTGITGITNFDLKNVIYSTNSSNYDSKQLIYQTLSQSFDSKIKQYKTDIIGFDKKQIIYNTSSANYDMRNILFQQSNVNFDTKNQLFNVSSANYDTKQSLYNSLNILFDTLQQISDGGITGSTIFDLKLLLYSNQMNNFDIRQNLYTSGNSRFDSKQSLYKSSQSVNDILFKIYNNSSQNIDLKQVLYKNDAVPFDMKHIHFNTSFFEATIRNEVYNQKSINFDVKQIISKLDSVELDLKQAMYTSSGTEFDTLQALLSDFKEYRQVIEFILNINSKNSNDLNINFKNEHELKIALRHKYNINL